MDSKIDLGVKIGNIHLDNPVMTASGTFGYGPEYDSLVDIDALGAIIVKGTTLEPRQGNPYPRMVETPAGMLNAVGLQNGGIDKFIDEIYPVIKHYKCKIIVNVSGSQPQDYAEVCRRLAPLPEVDAVEINISCPNVKQGGITFGTTTQGAGEITRICREAYPGTLIVKLTPNVTDVVSIARAVEDNGADAVSLINTLLGMAVDVEHRRAALSTVTGGLSGPAVKPVAVRMVWQTAKALKIPVIGLGGICNTKDALEFIMAGATAIQIGTANFVNPHVSTDVIKGLTEYCRNNGFSSLDEVRGII